MQIVVLAGGMVTVESERLSTALVPVLGRPFIDWQLDGFAAAGARSVVLCVGQQGDRIETHVGRALDRGLSVSYSYEGEQALGSGGALRRALPRLEAEFVLTLGQHYLPFDYAAPWQLLHARPEALAILSVTRRSVDLGPGRVALDGDRVARYEVGGRDAGLDHVDCGAVALRRAALEGIEDGAVWAIDALFRKLARQRKLGAFVAPSGFYSVESLPERLALERHLASQPEALSPPV